MAGRIRSTTMPQLRYITPTEITVTRSTSRLPYVGALNHILDQLDNRRGFYLSSGYEFPGRYSRWDIASVAPLIEITSAGRKLEVKALNLRGKVFLQLIQPMLAEHPHWTLNAGDPMLLHLELAPIGDRFPEEERSKQPSPFSLLRLLVHEFKHADDSRLSLVGAFGYDLLLQFDPITLRLPRTNHRDLHLFLCDDIYFIDRKKEIIERFQYEFSRDSLTTKGLKRTTPRVKSITQGGSRSEIVSDHTPEEYMKKWKWSARECA